MLGYVKTLRLLLLAGLALGATPLVAQDDKDVTKGKWKLPPDESFEQVVPPPPAPGSPMDQADLAYSLAVQATATPEEIAEARRLSGFDVFTFADDLGPDFTPEKFPATKAFFKKLTKTANKPKNYLKDKHRRPRPYLAHEGKIKLIAEKEEGYSYPSGHSTRSWLFALVLAELKPEMNDKFIIEAALVGHSRIVGGMHNVSDVIISRALAQAIFDALMKDTQFKQDLAALKKVEWTDKN